MFDLFELKRVSEKNRIIGYSWQLDDPDYVVVQIHGIGEYEGRYDRVAGYFQRANIAMVGMDLRGHGRSMGPKGHCAPRKAVLEDIDELIEYAQIRYPDTPIVLYGHSMGGNIGLDYRARGKYNADMAGYIITAPWVLLVQTPPKWMVTSLSALEKIAPSMTVSTKVNQADLGNLISVGRYDEDPLVHHRISLETAMDGYFIGQELAQGIHEDNGLARDIPMLLMHGTSDKLCDISGSRLIAQHEGKVCTFVEWAGYFHEVHNGNKEVDGEEAILSMVRFIKSLPKDQTKGQETE